MEEKGKDDLSGQLRKLSGKTPEEIALLKARLRDTYSEELSVDAEQGSKKKKKEKKIHCITRAMAEDFSREHVLFSSLIETIFYIIFAVSCCLHVTNLKSSDMYYMTEAIKQGLVNKQFGSEDEGVSDIKFEDISTVTDLWLYMTLVFIETLYFDKYFNKFSTLEKEKRLSVLYENVVLGVPRLRQVRVTEDSCEVHPYFRKLFKLCYSAYDEYSEAKTSFGLNKGTPWTYSNEEITDNINVIGKVATYFGGGYYLDLDSDGAKAKKQIDDLKENLWITRHTRAVFLSFSVYNTNLNIFGVCQLIFELPPTGGVLPSYKFDCVKLISSEDDWDYYNFVCETIFYVFIFVYCLQSLREFFYFKFKYFLKFWSYIDCTITGFAISTFVLSYYKKNLSSESIKKIKENLNEYGNVEHITYLQSLHDDLSAICLFFVFVRFFKYLNFNRTMGQLNDTLKKCAFDVLGFSIMFFIIFFAYAELGFLLFGAQVADFRTFGHSMFTLLRTILGDFDYEAIEQANRVLAPIYFLSYIFLVFFVLLNMFLAIINDTYADVKTEIAVAPTELQMLDYLKMNFFKLFKRFPFIRKFGEGAKKEELNLTVNEIREALEKCGFSFLEIEMFFARYNINPLALVTEYDVNKLVVNLESVAPSNLLETKTSAERARTIDDLYGYKKRLQDLEASMFKLASKIDELIQKLGQISGRPVWQKPTSESSDL